MSQDDTKDQYSKKPVVWVIYYSLHGHVRTLAEQIEKGLVESGVDVKVYQIPETLPPDVVEKMHGIPQKNFFDKHPLVPFDDLPKADGYLFGMSTRFGMMPAQFKEFWDRTGQFWQTGALAGKMAGLFFSTATQGGGQETIGLTTIAPMSHHAMIFVPRFPSRDLRTMEEVCGGSGYGSGTFSADNHPTDREKKYSHHQGKTFGNVVLNYHKGKNAK